MTDSNTSANRKKKFYIVFAILLVLLLVSIGFLIYTLTNEKKKITKEKVEHTDLNSELNALGNNMKVIMFSHNELVEALNNYEKELKEYAKEKGNEKVPHTEFIPIFYEKYKEAIDKGIDPIMNQLKIFFSKNKCDSMSQVINDVSNIVSAFKKSMDNKYLSAINDTIKEIETIKYQDDIGIKNLFDMDFSEYGLTMIDVMAYIFTRGQKLYFSKLNNRIENSELASETRNQVKKYVLTLYKNFKTLLSNIILKISKEHGKILANLHKEITEMENKLNEMIDKKIEFFEDPVFIGTMFNHGFILSKLVLSILSNTPGDEGMKLKMLIEFYHKMDIDELLCSLIRDIDILLKVIARLCKDGEYSAENSKDIKELIKTNCSQDGTIFKMLNLFEKISKEKELTNRTIN